MMISLASTLHNYMFMGATFLLLFQAIVLLARCKNNVARKTMALLESFWGIGYLGALILINFVVGAEEYVLFREKYVLLGGIYISFMVVYLMQILIPGWLNWKRFLFVESPILFLALIFYGGTFALGESVVSITSYSMLFDSIGMFNVWFRFVILFIEMIYILWMLKWLYHYKNQYVQWEKDNFSNTDAMDISWIRFYYYMILGITLFYLGVFFIGGHITVLCHTAFVCIVLSYLFYKSLLYESPYPDNYFESLDEDQQKLKSDEIYVVSDSNLDKFEESTGLTDQTFESKIPEYTGLLRKWLDDEKPYLYKDFKLTDVSRVLPLNRSYLSRVFNEGFGKNFSDVVRFYRIEYSMNLLIENTALPLSEIAERSGFSSDSTYIRSFKQVNGITPSQFKNQRKD